MENQRVVRTRLWDEKAQIPKPNAERCACHFMVTLQQQEKRHPRPLMYLTFYLSIFPLFCHFFAFFMLFITGLHPPIHGVRRGFFLLPTKPNGNEFMHHILPFSGLSQDTTHHYCHSLFQSCCYILKTLGAGVVLIPDYCPAQCIQQGQTPFKPVFIASLTIDIITCACGTD